MGHLFHSLELVLEGLDTFQRALFFSEQKGLGYSSLPSDQFKKTLLCISVFFRKAVWGSLVSALALKVVTVVSCESLGCSEASFSSMQLALERMEV